MRVVRAIARPMLAGVFVVAGLDVLANPEPRAKMAKPAGHPFWEIDDPVNRSRQRTQFLENTAILGGLVVVALD